ncbi:MAG: hypothetical protein GX456_19265 [Verrucomicrobia bacterium]|nr:hypothetical protein [Verrucomicrobiota bacterium]
MRPQTTCLSPYRHPKGSSRDFGNRRLEQGTIGSPRHDPGENTNNEPVTLFASQALASRGASPALA